MIHYKLKLNTNQEGCEYYAAGTNFNRTCVLLEVGGKCSGSYDQIRLCLSIEETENLIELLQKAKDEVERTNSSDNGS